MLQLRVREAAEDLDSWEWEVTLLLMLRHPLTITKIHDMDKEVEEQEVVKATTSELNLMITAFVKN
jgi:hypothetical protein